MIRTDRHRLVVDGDAPHGFAATAASVLKLKPDSLDNQERTIAWVIRSLSADGCAAFDAEMSTAKAYAGLVRDFSALRQGGVRGTPQPTTFYEKLVLETDLVKSAAFTLDGHILLDSVAGWLTKAEFECLYETTMVEHICARAKDAAAVFRRYLALDQAAPATFRITYEDDGAIGSETLIARSRDHVVEYLKQRKLKAIDWNEQ